jgi:uncharacterized protein DUF3108
MSLRLVTTYPYHSPVCAKIKPPLRFAPLFALIVFLAATVTAQTKNDPGPPPFNAAVYRLGERLTYNVNYSQFISAAHVELMVAGRGIFFERNGIQLKAHVETTGVVNVALLSLNNDYTTYVFAESGLPYRSQQVVREAGRTSEASVDYNQPAGTDAIPPKLRIGETAGIYDLLSTVYRIRATPLTMSSRYLITVRNVNEEYQAEVRVIGKEYVKTGVGSFDAIVTTVRVKGGPDYDIHVYFSDDEWHVPVMLTARQGDADVRADLAASALEAPAVTAPSTRANVDPVKQPPRVIPPPVNSDASALTAPASPAVLDLPFKVGEQLNYRVYMGKGAQPIGTLNFNIKSRGRYFNRDGLQFTASAQTTGAAILAVRDQMTSYVDPTTLLPFRTEINFSEGKYTNSRSYNLDQDRGAATTENSRDRVEIPVGTHDLLSAFYSLRTFTLSINKQNSISIMAVNRPRALTITAQRRETLELNGQKIDAIVLDLKTDDPQPDKLQIKIWVGDDSRHLPLRITAVTDLGAMRADLVVVPTTPRKD